MFMKICTWSYFSINEGENKRKGEHSETLLLYLLSQEIIDNRQKVSETLSQPIDGNSGTQLSSQ
jgi:hypothetical protein